MGYCLRLLAVTAMTHLSFAAAAQVPADSTSTEPVAAADQSPEIGDWSNSPLGVSGPSGWGAPFYDDRGQLYLRLEYLNWWLSGNPLPPLVTTSPLGTDPILGMPGSRVLFGDDVVEQGSRGGFRGTLGVRLAHWFETDLELEGHLIVLGGDREDSGDFFVASTGKPILGRPFFNVQTGSEDALVIAAADLPFPDPVTGLPDSTLLLESAELQVASTSDLDVAGLAVRRRWREGADRWLDLVAGYRYLRYQEGLDIQQFQLFRDPSDPRRTGTVDVRDTISTWNEFHGGEVGFVAYWERGPLSVELLARAAFGNVRQILEITGASVVTRPDAPTVVGTSSGFLAAPSNIGRHAANRFDVVPEVGITLRRSFTRSFAVTVGYTLIVFPEVLRTGDQIDRGIDPSQTTARPTAMLNDSVLWIQGVNIGLEW